MNKDRQSARLLKLAYRLKQFRQNLSYNPNMDYNLWLRYINLVCKVNALLNKAKENK